jgi:deoxyribodipyrimidine photo-lyase
MSTALVWFRRDLRLRDHPALTAALAAHEHVVPVFCLDDRLLAGRHASGPRTAFLLECLADLDGALRERGGRLVLLHERPETGLVTLARQVGATEVYYTRDVTPFARARGGSVRRALAEAGVAERALPGLTAVDDVGEIRTRAGGPYSVFSPFHRTWQDAPRRRVVPEPDRVPVPVLNGVSGLDVLPTLAGLGLKSEVSDPRRGGERAALERLAWFLDGPVHRYPEDRDLPALDGTSKLSAYLHFGCVSPRAIEAALPDSEGARAFRRQLCWRDFYHHVQLHHPQNARQEYQERYRGTLTWPGDASLFTAWAEGRTGFPLIDAAMRQLLREGWMHNRTRLLTGSFLTKQLGVDWREGEAWFMRLLLDGDQPNNNGNWQWIASVGVDPQPVFRRVYNPTLHQQRYDPDGVYVREYVPELRRVPGGYLAEPWTMPLAVQRAAGCVVGVDYPEPVVDLKASREQALARYRDAAADSA